MHAVMNGAFARTVLDFSRLRIRDLPGNPTDDLVRRTLAAGLAREPWWNPRRSNIFIDNGKVVYQGLIDDAGTRRVARRIAEAIPGVTSVWDARVPRRESQGSV